MDRKTRIAAVVSLFWVGANIFFANGYYSFDGEQFSIIGLAPVAAYWGWWFINMKKD